MAEGRIITNRLDVNVDYAKMLEGYSFYLVTINKGYSIHLSIYASLEETLTSRPGCSIIAFDKDKRTKGDVDYRRLYVIVTHKTSAITKSEIEKILPKCDYTIEEADGFALRKHVPTNQILNLLLTLMPNKNMPVLYAHGKYLVGGCMDWNRNSVKRGEYVFLHVFFDSSCCLRSMVQTLTQESQFKSKKELKGNIPYYISFTNDNQIHLSTRAQVKDDDKYYDIKPKVRKNDKNSLPFLCYKSIYDFKQSQVYVIYDIINRLSDAYSSFLSLEQKSYTPVNTFLGKGAKIEDEEKFLLEYKTTHNIRVEVLDENTSTVRMKKEVESILKEVYTPGSTIQDAVIRIVPSLSIDESLGKDERNKEKTRQSISKYEYLQKGIAVQDITEDHENLGKATVENLIRQLAVKESCQKGVLPEYVASHYNGSTIIYGQYRNECYDIVILTIQEQRITKVFDTAASDRNTVWIEHLGLALTIQETGTPGEKNELFFILKDGVTYQIANTSEFVFPEVGVMAEKLEERERITIPISAYSELLPIVNKDVESSRICNQRIRKGIDVCRSDFDTDSKIIKRVSAEANKQLSKIRKQVGYTVIPDFKNKENVIWTLSAYSNIAFWELPDSKGKHWCYSVGLRSINYSTKTEFPHKTHIRHVFVSEPVSSETIRELIIDSLQDGWLRMNEFSVEPSIFKFAREAMEIHQTEYYAHGGEYVK